MQTFKNSELVCRFNLDFGVGASPSPAYKGLPYMVDTALVVAVPSIPIPTAQSIWLYYNIHSVLSLPALTLNFELASFVSNLAATSLLFV